MKLLSKSRILSFKWGKEKPQTKEHHRTFNVLKGCTVFAKKSTLHYENSEVNNNRVQTNFSQLIKSIPQVTLISCCGIKKQEENIKSRDETDYI